MSIKLLINFLFLILLISCASTPQPSRDVSELMSMGKMNQNKMKKRLSDIERSTGSLYANNYHSQLFSNMYRASKVGDTITVLIDESTTGVNSGNTSSNRKQDQKHTILGGLGDLLGKFAGFLNPSNFLNSNSESKFSGDGSTTRTGTLKGVLTVQIVSVLENGNYEIVGKKDMKINSEQQVLIVEGIIRPYDIMPNNSVMSSSIADAKITFSGFGVVAEKQKPGWLIRALDLIWPL